MQTIQIDFDVYKVLTTKRKSESESYNDVLRQMLGLPFQSKHLLNGPSRAWIIKGVTFPEGTQFRANYKGKVYHAKIEGGQFMMDGRRFDSPSQAAVYITKNSVNGWIFWEACLPGEATWKLLKSFRQN